MQLMKQKFSNCTANDKGTNYGSPSTWMAKYHIYKNKIKIIKLFNTMLVD